MTEKEASQMIRESYWPDLDTIPELPKTLIDTDALEKALMEAAEAKQQAMDELEVSSMATKTAQLKYDNARKLYRQLEAIQESQVALGLKNMSRRYSNG